MKLITEEIKKVIPKLYEQDGKGWNAIAYIKFFTPDSSWTWYATEFDGKDLFFGLDLTPFFSPVLKLVLSHF